MKTNWTKRRKWLLACIAAVALILIASYFIQQRINLIIEQKIHTAIPGEYINYTGVQTKLFSGKILVSEVKVNIHADGKKSAIFHNIYIKNIQLNGIKFLNIFFKKELFIRSIILDSSKIDINDKLFQDSTATYDHLKNSNNAFKKIEINNIRLKYLSVNKNFYKYNLSGLYIRSELKTFDAGLDSLRIIPLYSKETFNRLSKFQSDRITALITGLHIDKVNLAALRTKELKANDILVNSAAVFVFRDRRLPRKEEKQPLPALMLKKIPFSVHLNSLKIQNSFVEYEEFPKNGTKPGTLKVEHLTLSIAPMITHPQKSDPSQMILRIKGSLMGSGTVSTTMTLPLRSNEYVVHGSIQNLDLIKLNDPAENLGNIHIKSGLLDSLGFQFSFNESRSVGKIVGIYHQLVIQPLGKTKKIQGFKSFMLRHLIIPLNKDRSLAERKRTGKINYKRDPTRKISFYLLQSLLTGIKSSFSLGFLLP